MEARRTSALLVLALLAVQLLQVASSPVATPSDGASTDLQDSPPPTLKDCPVCPPCQHKQEHPCEKASVGQEVLGALSLVLSIGVCLVPSFRVWDLLGTEHGDKHTFFRFFLALGAGDYLVWVWYTLFGGFCLDAVIFMGLASGGGFIIYVVLFCITTSKLHYGRFDDPITFVFFVILCACFILIIFWKVPNVLGIAGLILAVFSQLCRIGSTDYSNLNWILLGASAVGTLNGFLWTVHPHLEMAFYYKITNFIIGCFRGVEIFLWMAPYIARALSIFESKNKTEGSRSVGSMTLQD